MIDIDGKFCEPSIQTPLDMNHPPNIPALPAHILVNHNVHQAYQIINQTYHNSLCLLNQDNHDILQLQFHCDQLQDHIFPLLRALSNDDSLAE